MIKLLSRLAPILIVSSLSCNTNKDDTSSSNPPDPVEEFKTVHQGIQDRASPRQYVERSFGSFDPFSDGNLLHYDNYRQLSFIYNIGDFDVLLTDSLRTPYEASWTIVTTELTSPDFPTYSAAATAKPTVNWRAVERSRTVKIYYRDGEWIAGARAQFSAVDEPTRYDRPSTTQGKAYKRIE